MADPELVACLSALPSFINLLEQNVSTADLNMVHIFTLKAEDFVELTPGGDSLDQHIQLLCTVS